MKIAQTETGHDSGRSTIRTAETSEPRTEAAGAALRQSVSTTTELGQLFVKLCNEQMRHQASLAAAFGRTVNWGELVTVQTDFVRASFERMNRMSSRYVELFQGSMKKVPVSGS